MSCVFAAKKKDLDLGITLLLLLLVISSSLLLLFSLLLLLFVGPDMYGNKLLPGLSVPAVRLLPYLEQHYTREFINNICIMKIDTEVE